MFGDDDLLGGALALGAVTLEEVEEVELFGGGCGIRLICRHFRLNRFCGLLDGGDGGNDVGGDDRAFALARLAFDADEGLGDGDLCAGGFGHDLLDGLVLGDLVEDGALGVVLLVDDVPHLLIDGVH